MIVALLIPALFIGAVLAAGLTLWSSWHRYGGQALAISGELRACEPTRTFRYETMPSPRRRSARIFRLAFKPRTNCLPFQPDLRAAA